MELGAACGVVPTYAIHELPVAFLPLKSPARILVIVFERKKTLQSVDSGRYSTTPHLLYNSSPLLTSC